MPNVSRSMRDRTMKRFALPLLLLMLLMVAVGVWYAFFREGKERRPRFTVSKETTYVTDPPDKDGYIDYAAALNERVSRRMSRRGMI